ncbi:MAG: DUF3299 domain-containing protein [Gammaproteobacteria bacterium]|nr:DUF3299 domain-containing protein [Gammaproteobacteria bacterium]
MKKILYVGAMLLLGYFSPVHSETINGQQVNELDWDNLMPEYLALPQEGDVMFDAQQFAELTEDPMTDLATNAPLASAAVMPELDGQIIRIPGFVVPLVEDGLKITEFFLVPYFGACIHVPPPPANQMLHVTFPAGIEIDSIYDAVTIVGKLTIATVTNEMGTAGYKLEAISIEPYQL